MKKVVVLSMVMMLMGFVSIAGAVPAVPDFVIVTTIDAFDAENIRYNGTKAIVENFNDAKINTPGLSITEFGGAGTFTLGYYENIVDKDANPPRYQEFTYAPTLHGFGGWFDLANPGGPGSSIDVYVGAALVGNIPNTFAGQFWGFYSNIGPFSTVTFKEGPGSAQETYQVVDLALCSAAPIPGSVLLMGTGILGLVGVGIRRKL